MLLDKENWLEIYSSVKKHKLRTFLTAFGVFWGIFMLVLLLGAGKGLQNGVYQMFGNAAKNTVYIWPGITQLPYHGLPAGRSVTIDNPDVNLIRQKVPGMRYLAPSLNLPERMPFAYGENKYSLIVKGVHPDFSKIKSIRQNTGRFLNMDDFNTGSKIAVIGEHAKTLLFGEGYKPGSFVHIKGVPFKVIGTFTIDEAENQKDNAETVFIPLTTLQQTFGYNNQVSLLSITPSAGVPARALEQKVKAILESRHSISPDDKGALNVYNSEEEFFKYVNLFGGINLFIWIVGAGTIIAGIIGVGNIMLIVVKERTREIGIRKALGATPAAIVSLIIMESVLITGIAGYTGLATGVLLLEALKETMARTGLKSDFFKDPQVDIQVALTATFILVTTGVLAGFVPARKAAKINPIEALKAE